MVVFIFLLGLCIGSFIAAYTYRLPRNISIAKGRSFCDSCHKPLSWKDNIPLFSYLLLRGKSRCCKVKISPRYPLLELSTAILFCVVYYLSPLILNSVSFMYLPLSLFLISTSIAIFVVDIEYQIIPDEFIWWPLALSLIFFLIFGTQDFFERIFVSFCSSLFLLVLNLATLGRGMGLGDVKYALLPGFILSFPLNIMWFFISFLLGSVVGIFIVLTQGVNIKSRIAFGPFLVLGFWITILFGDKLLKAFIPFLV